MRDAHLLLGPLVERHEADGGRRELPVRQQVTSALGEHPGLARSGRCDDPRRPTDVSDGSQLIGSEVGRGGVRAERGQRPVLEREPVHDDPTVERRREPERPPVEPGLVAARENDIGNAPGGGTQLDRPAGQGPVAGVGPATIDAVRPDEVVQLVQLEREPRPDLVGGPAFHLARRLFELGLQLDDHPLPRRAARTHPFDRGGRRADDRVGR